MFQIGLSMGAALISEEYFRKCNEAGIQNVEVSIGMGVDEPEVDYKSIKRWSEEYGIRLWSYHLPFKPASEINISAADPQIRDHTVAFHSEIIRRAAEIGIDKYVIHPSGERIGVEERYDRIQYAKENLVKLAQVAAQCGGTVAVENLPRACLGRNSDEMMELISADERLRVCFDTNHLLAENNVDFIHKLGNKIITTHVSDYDFTDERHWLPGEGKNDWTALINALQKVGYGGVWMYEVSFKCPPTIQRDRDLTHEDFARNAAELFKWIG